MSAIKPEAEALSFQIKSQWDGKPIDHEPVKIEIERLNNSTIQLKVNATLFNDPKPPDGRPGQPFPELWDYEVVEAFFLGEDDKYLEVEISPHGQHLVLLLNGRRHMIKDQLPLVYHSSKQDGKWSGVAEIPVGYLPSKVNKFNAYAIHGSEPNRIYEALYPAVEGKHSEPDFHRLEYFQSIDLHGHLPKDFQQSEVWI